VSFAYDNDLLHGSRRPPGQPPGRPVLPGARPL